jgi:hypothetical protein
VWSDYGWYWVSQEPFGWATFHYGRWLYDDYYGWIWIPDDVWGPAWVEWRYDDANIGWAPLTPYASFQFNVGIVVSSRWVAPVHYWNFVPFRYFTTARVVDYLQPIDRARRLFGSTRSAMNIEGNDRRVVNRGVDREFIERRTNSRIEHVDVITRDRGEGDRLVRSGDGSRVEAFRPRLEREAHQDARPESFRQDERRTSRPDASPRLKSREVQRNTQVERARPGGREVTRQPAERRQEVERKVYEQRQQQRERTVQEQKRSPQIQPQRQESRQQPVQRPNTSRGGREGRRRP